MSDRFTIASQWFFRLQTEDLSPSEFSDWMRWYEEDSRNRAAFEEAQALFEASRALPTDARARWAQDVMPARKIRQPWWSVVRGHGVWRLAGGAVALGVAAVALLFLTLNAPPQHVTVSFQTPLAKHGREILPDGSIVELGARSSISVNFSSESRYVVLEAGEALFTVAKDASRPFIVQAGQIRVRAIGTEFNVRRAGESTTVSVREGIVEVGSGKPNSRMVRVSAGELVVMDKSSSAPLAKSIDSAAVASWQQGRLEFDNEPLRVIVATVNRYSAREIVVTDPNLYDLRVTATVDERHIHEWLDGLSQILPVRVIEVSQGTVLLSPRGDS